MFPKEQRITTTKTILQVFRRGERRVFGCVSCYFIAKAGTVGKVTVIVDSKVARHAVDRNRLKRQIRGLLREYGLPSGLLIVRLLRGAPERTFPELQQYLTQCLQKLGITSSKKLS